TSLRGTIKACLQSLKTKYKLDRMRRYALALDLVNDTKLISEYEDYHREVWPEIKESIRAAGVVNMEIYRFKNRLFMIMRSEEHTSELQSRENVVCRRLLEKKKK